MTKQQLFFNRQNLDREYGYVLINFKNDESILINQNAETLNDLFTDLYIDEKTRYKTEINVHETTLYINFSELGYNNDYDLIATKVLMLNEIKDIEAINVE